MAGMLDRRTASETAVLARTPGQETRPPITDRQEAIRLSAAGRFAESEACSRETLRLRPDDIDVLNDLGVALWRQGRVAEAEAIYRRACLIKPDDFRMLVNLGLAIAEQGRMDEAEKWYRTALGTQRDAFEARIMLGVALSDQGHFDLAMDHFQATLALRPDPAISLWNIGMNLLRQGEWDAAIGCYERALEHAPEFPELHRDLAYALLGRGDFERGWQEHEWRIKCPGHTGFMVDRPLWRGEQFPRRIIMLHYEQGLGDTLQFMRFAPLVKERGGSVLVLCPAASLKLVARCPGVDLAFEGTSYQPDCHLQAPLMSLPAILGTTLKTLPAGVPYLATDPLVVAHWRSILEEALFVDAGAGRRTRPFLIGIAWQGKPTHRFDRWRSFPLAQLAPLCRLPGVRLISVQAEHGLDQLRALGGRFPVVELTRARPRDLLDTAALISLLDLVITPDSALAHVAGGLGVGVWVALGPMAEWRWMTKREDSPWYPTMRLFRQKTFGHWDDVFRRMASALEQELALRAAYAPQVA